MPKVLKKVTIGNPLYNYELFDELELYDSCQTDEELAEMYHDLLDLADHFEKTGQPHTVLRESIYSMIAFSTGYSFNVNMLFN